jgi:hypothetical protein
LSVPISYSYINLAGRYFAYLDAGPFIWHLDIPVDQSSAEENSPSPLGNLFYPPSLSPSVLDIRLTAFFTPNKSFKSEAVELCWSRGPVPDCNGSRFCV